MNSAGADDELVRRVAARNADALIELYQRHGRAVFSLAYYISRVRGTAEEITQDVFSALWQKANQFDAARGRLEVWLLRITRNLAIDRLRHQRRRIQNAISLDLIEPQAESSDDTERAEQRHELNRLLQQLPAAQRQAIELSYFQGFTHDEIAAKLQVPVGTVKSRILLALRKLKELL